MQGAGDGYFILPNTIGNYLSDKIKTPRLTTEEPEFEEAEKRVQEKLEKLININGSQTAASFHKRLGKIMWDHCGMLRSEEGLKQARTEVRELKEEFWNDLQVPGTLSELNQELEKAIRVADFMDMSQLLIEDALNRKESCGGHFREEYQTEAGEALRDDEHYMYVAAWEYQGEDQMPKLHKEQLTFEFVEVKERTYK
jgi:succinate dehydrogenase / fumarate reductase flavoprotein subunit